MILRESYFRYAMHDDDEATAREKIAKQIYDYYQNLYRDENRIDLPEFKMVKYLALRDFLNDRQFPVQLRQNLLGRIKIEKPQLFQQLQNQAEVLRKQSQQQQKR